MFRRENRLQKERDINRVFKKGKGFKEDFLFLKLLKNDLGENRFAIVVSRKVAKKAILRNKIRRRLREAIKNRASIRSKGEDEGLSLIAKKKEETKVGLDIILVVLPGFGEKEPGEIKKSLAKLFLKAKLL